MTLNAPTYRENVRPWELLLTSQHYQETLQGLSKGEFLELGKTAINPHGECELKPVRVFEFRDEKLIFLDRFGRRCPIPPREEILARLGHFQAHLAELEGIPSDDLEVVPIPRLLVDGFEDVRLLSDNASVRWNAWNGLDELRQSVVTELVHPDPRIRAFAAWDLLVMEKEMPESLPKENLSTLVRASSMAGKVKIHRPWLDLDLAEAVLLRQSGIIKDKPGQVEVLLGQYDSRKHAFLGLRHSARGFEVSTVSEQFNLGDPTAYQREGINQQKIYARRGRRLSNSHLRK